MARSPLALLVAMTVAVAGCGGSGEPGPEGAATVLAASSLSEALPAIDPAASFSFGGSDRLAFQIEQGTPADVIASAGPAYTTALHDKGLVLPPRVFATNRLAVIVPAANPAGIRAVADLARPGVTLVIGERAVPVGAYARTAMARLGLGDALANVVSEEQDAAAIVAKVALGEVDAGLAYVTDAASARGRVTAIPVPSRGQPVIEYTVAVVSSTRNRAAADAFVARLVGPRGRAVLARLGFGLPEGG